jgi:hypothetical protein
MSPAGVCVLAELKRIADLSPSSRPGGPEPSTTALDPCSARVDRFELNAVATGQNFKSWVLLELAGMPRTASWDILSRPLRQAQGGLYGTESEQSSKGVGWAPKVRRRAPARVGSVLRAENGGAQPTIAFAEQPLMNLNFPRELGSCSRLLKVKHDNFGIRSKPQRRSPGARSA